MHVHIYKSMIQLFRQKSNDKVVLGIGINDVRTHVRDVNIYKGISINIYISIRYLKPLVFKIYLGSMGQFIQKIT